MRTVGDAIKFKYEVIDMTIIDTTLPLGQQETIRGCTEGKFFEVEAGMWPAITWERAQEYVEKELINPNDQWTNWFQSAPHEETRYQQGAYVDKKQFHRKEIVLKREDKKRYPGRSYADGKKEWKGKYFAWKVLLQLEMEKNGDCCEDIIETSPDWYSPEFVTMYWDKDIDEDGIMPEASAPPFVVFTHKFIYKSGYDSVYGSYGVVSEPRNPYFHRQIVKSSIAHEELYYRED